ncbi:MAG: asparagine synthase (glutamine-hydrolyzing) [Rhodopseudomonas sp.]|nr:asparagine synthase (glutamine-hydrolyzing) [Rhodopseudomonas sp.]
MCGIAGVFGFGRSAGPDDAAVVARLNALQSRRGPDGEGLWTDEGGRVVLGHRRLAIVDIGAAGAQPMADASGRWLISFNGEIYNYRELRRDLEAQGCRFLTHSDTEVLINVVAHWGEAGLRRLRGMFAFALYDRHERELWLARDPYGIKPLYVASRDGVLWFASQARALAEAAPVDTGRSAAGLVGFYLWGHVPEPFAWWRGIGMLPAGHLQRIAVDKPLPASRCYSRVQDAFAAAPPAPIGSADLRAALLDSVRHHLMADVPVGIFLSAGIDSNAIAALATLAGAPPMSLTVTFDDYAGTDADEAPLAEAAAKRLGGPHRTVRIGREQFDAMRDDFLRGMDQPTIDGLNTYFVSHAAAGQGLKVALSGLGGDELFGGYPSFRQIPALLKFGRWASRHPRWVSALTSGLKGLARAGGPPKLTGLVSHSVDPGRAYMLRRALYLANELDALLDESWLRAGLEELQSERSLADTIAPPDAARLSFTEHAQIAMLESCWYMRNQLLRDADWAGMAHGVEVRLPFVDMPLLQRLAPAIASNAPPSKIDMAASVGGIPEEVIGRTKTGFTTPVRQWIARRDLHGRAGVRRGLRGWAAELHRLFRRLPEPLAGRRAAA